MKESRIKQSIFMALCIISVVCAHTQVSSDKNIMLYYEVEKFLGNIGCIGVAGFFILSGYTFFISKRSGVDFWKRKVITLVIPWLFWSVFYGLLNYIKNGAEQNSFVDFVTSWAGSYYIYTLIILYLLFKFIKNNKIRVCVGTLSLCVDIAYCTHILKWNSSPYLSLFPWIHWFVLGLFYEKILVALEKWEERKEYCALLVSVTVLSNIFAMRSDMNYFSVYYIPFAIVNLFFLHWISNKLFKLKGCRIYLGMIGNQTLWIMFTNFYVTVICAKLLLSINNGIALLLAPIVTTAMLGYLAIFLKSMERKIKVMYLINKIIGIR